MKKKPGRVTAPLCKTRKKMLPKYQGPCNFTSKVKINDDEPYMICSWCGRRKP